VASGVGSNGTDYKGRHPMTRSEMLRRLRRGEDPRDLSEEKWDNIRHGKGVDRLDENCALCEEYFGKACEGCIVYIKTGKRACNNTPYREWREHQDNKHSKFTLIKVRCPECKRLADKEWRFLRSLRK